MQGISVPRTWPSGSAGVVAMLAPLVVTLAGCRTGTWTPPSSWSMFGSTSKATGGLTDAPDYAQGPNKPAATATPYPTTSTPDSYVINDRASGPGTAAVAGGPPAATPEVGAVVYGTAPAESPAAARYASLPPSTIGGPTPGAAGAAAQVGPYAGSGAAASGPPAVSPPPAGGIDRFSAAVDALPAGNRLDPADDPAARIVGEPRSDVGVPPSSALPPASFPGSPPSGPSPATSSASAWPAATPPRDVPASSADAYAGPNSDSRYATGGSRYSAFGGGAPAATPSAPQDAFPSQSFPPAVAPPLSAPAAGLAPLQPTAPAAAPAAAPLTAPPSRRPDPGYRPGGTSSYQPRSGGVPGSTGIQPVAFEAPASR